MDHDPLEYPPFPEFLGALMQLDEPVENHVPLDENGYFERALLPLRGIVLFPKMMTPLFVGRDRSLNALGAAAQLGESVIVVAQKDSEMTDPAPDDLFVVGTEIAIGKSIRLPDSSTSILCQGQQRVEIVEYVQWEPYIRVRVRPIPDPDSWNDQTEALMRATTALFEKAVELNPKLHEDAITFAINATTPGWLADFICTAIEFPIEVKQAMLEIIDPMERLQQATVLLAREVDLYEAEHRIHAQVQREIDRTQREHFLREQLRAIQGELGEGDVFAREVNELREIVDSAEYPEEVRAKIEKELARLNSLPPMSPEMGVIRTYLDWLIQLPWYTKSDDNLDVNHAAQVLDEDHYALDQVKDRILEFIAVKKIAPDSMKTPILCFVGPPGTGKTSLGKSIARALNRKFVRMSLGGMRDEAEIRGHRRTYIGSLPGRVIQSIKRVGTRNPLFMLDEIDKIGQDFRGDPASALLEVLDPEQNDTFRDLYLDVDFDLRDVLFITTANSLEPIPPPLRDRMEVIEFSGYLEEEKIEICRQFIIPRQLVQHGLSEAGLKFEDDALKMLIRQYTYEAGVRNLEREVANVCRKVARRMAEGRKFPKRINKKRLDDLLGAPRFSENMLREADEIGVATGVAWTAAGGDTLSIEVNLMNGKGNLMLTGKLGEVMQESAKAALTYTRSQAERLGIDPNRFEKTDIHIHVPEGSVPKDGPSAGVPLTMALVSAFTDRPIRREVGMTGEITLRGRILPVGGIREKALAARRVGISTFVMPKKNHTDLQNIPKKLRQDINFVEVDRIHQVIDVALYPCG